MATEYPPKAGDPYYPVPNDENRKLYRRYEELSRSDEYVTFVGRLARYQYLNMDQVVAQALGAFERLRGSVPGSAPVGPAELSVVPAGGALGGEADRDALGGLGANRLGRVALDRVDILGVADRQVLAEVERSGSRMISASASIWMPRSSTYSSPVSTRRVARGSRSRFLTFWTSHTSRSRSRRRAP